MCLAPGRTRPEGRDDGEVTVNPAAWDGDRKASMTQ